MALDHPELSAKNVKTLTEELNLIHEVYSPEIEAISSQPETDAEPTATTQLGADLFDAKMRFLHAIRDELAPKLETIWRGV